MPRLTKNRLGRRTNRYEPVLLLRCNLLFHPVTAEKRIRDAAKYCRMVYSEFIRTAIIDRLAEVEAAMQEEEL